MPPHATHSDTNSAATSLVDHALRALPPDYLERNGRFFYSAASTLQESPVYLLGLNPGGSPGEGTLREQIELLPGRTKNAYLDECWKRRDGSEYEKGQKPLQRRVQWMLRKLDLDPASVPASNLIFQRSRSQSQLEGGIRDQIKKCWCIHQAVIGAIKPRAVIVFHLEGARVLAEMLDASISGSFPSGHAEWTCQTWRAPGFNLIGIPHLSRYAIDQHKDVIDWIRWFIQ